MAFNMKRMKCPICNQEVELILEHYQKKHPRKLNYLRKQKPEIYKKLEKDSEIYKMVNSQNRNLFVLKTGSERRYYKYQCVRCGKCCHEYDVEIKPEDIDKWEDLGRNDFLKFIQIDPKNIAMGNMDFFKNFGDHELINLDLSTFYNALDTGEKLDENYMTKIGKIRSIMEEVSSWVFSNGELNNQIQLKIGKLRDFISNNHKYLGEPPSADRYGKTLDNPLIEEFKGVKVPNWLLGGDYLYRSIFSPKTFQIIRNGWNYGLRYMLINELFGGCGFLDQETNLCKIHDEKPKICREYPYDKRKLKEKEHKRFLDTCLGLKRI